jgi:hypothetical protein
MTAANHTARLTEAQSPTRGCRWGRDRVLPEKESFRMDYSDLAEERFVVGSPDLPSAPEKEK